MEREEAGSSMMQSVQLAITDSTYAAAVRDALARSCAWHVEAVEDPDPSRQSVMVLDEGAFARLPLPLSNPERVVLIARKDPQFLAQAWEAGIVSVVSADDPLNTVLLAIMSAALRVAKPNTMLIHGGISPTTPAESAPLAPPNQISGSKRRKYQ